MFLNQPISSRGEEKTNVLVCAIFIMKKQPFILEKRCSFLLADIGIFIDFLVLEKKKTKMCSIDSCKPSIFKKDEEKQSKKLIVPFIKFKSAKKQDSFRVCSFYIHSKSDVNTISDLIRVEKYVDNNIQIFSSVMRSDMKNINRKVLWRFCLGRMFETLRQEKKFITVLFGLSENNCHDHWFGSM